MSIILVRSLSRRDYLVEVLGLKGLSPAYQLRMQRRLSCENLWADLGRIIDHF